MCRAEKNTSPLKSPRRNKGKLCTWTFEGLWRTIKEGSLKAVGTGSRLHYPRYRKG
jgi:hypothetical protein